MSYMHDYILVVMIGVKDLRQLVRCHVLLPNFHYFMSLETKQLGSDSDIMEIHAYNLQIYHPSIPQVS